MLQQVIFLLIMLIGVRSCSTAMAWLPHFPCHSGPLALLRFTCAFLHDKADHAFLLAKSSISLLSVLEHPGAISVSSAFIEVLCGSYRPQQVPTAQSIHIDLKRVIPTIRVGRSASTQTRSCLSCSSSLAACICLQQRHARTDLTCLPILE